VAPNVPQPRGRPRAGTSREGWFSARLDTASRDLWSGKRRDNRNAPHAEQTHNQFRQDRKGETRAEAEAQRRAAKLQRRVERRKIAQHHRHAVRTASELFRQRYDHRLPRVKLPERELVVEVERDEQLVARPILPNRHSRKLSGWKVIGKRSDGSPQHRCRGERRRSLFRFHREVRQLATFDSLVGDRRSQNFGQPVHVNSSSRRCSRVLVSPEMLLLRKSRLERERLQEPCL
jgi:hypothetical protein